MNVTGRWAFRVDHGSQRCEFNSKMHDKHSASAHQYQIQTIINLTILLFCQAIPSHRAHLSGQMPLARRGALAPAGVSNAVHSLAPSLKPVVLQLSSMAAKIFNGRPAPFLVIPTTTPSIIRSFTFKEPALTFCLRYRFQSCFLYLCGVKIEMK